MNDWKWQVILVIVCEAILRYWATFWSAWSWHLTWYPNINVGRLLMMNTLPAKFKVYRSKGSPVINHTSFTTDRRQAERQTCTKAIRTQSFERERNYWWCSWAAYHCRKSSINTNYTPSAVRDPIIQPLLCQRALDRQRNVIKLLSSI